MLLEDDVKRKDFSVALPAAIHKLRAVGGGILFEACDHGQPPIEVLHGWHHIIHDIIDDLSAINEALYGS
jgi:hypothetical protein